MWIWFNLEPEKLPKNLAFELQNDHAEFGISAVSIWEAMVAMEKGRVATAASPETTLDIWLRDTHFKVIPLDQRVAILSRTLGFDYEDPADRFIAATAFHLKCPLATADVRLKRIPWLDIFQ